MIWASEALLSIVVTGAVLELFFKEIKVEFKSEIIELKKPSGLNLKCIFF